MNTTNMISKHKDIIVVSNPKCDLPNGVFAAMNARRDAHISELRERAARVYQLQPSDEERQVQQNLRSSLLALTGLREEDAERLAQSQRTRLQQILAAIKPQGNPPHLSPLDPSPTAGEGELWWAQTYFTASPHLVAFFQDDGIHLGGTLVWRSGNLDKVNMTVVAQFGLGPDRMPSGKAVRFVSNPFAEVYGQISGVTWGWGLFDGDQWAKCWLNTKQTVYGGIPLPFHIPSAFGSETRTLIFVENSSNQLGTLPGFFALPPVAFLLADRTTPLQVDLEFSFDFQLEGDAQIDISGLGADNSAVLRTYQWKIVPVE